MPPPSLLIGCLLLLGSASLGPPPAGAGKLEVRVAQLEESARSFFSRFYTNEQDIKQLQQLPQQLAAMEAVADDMPGKGAFDA